MNAFKLTRYFPDFVDTDAQRDYGLHDTLSKAKKKAQGVWDEWKDENKWQRERLKWGGDDAKQIHGIINSGNKNHPEMVVFLIHPAWEFEAPEINYKFEDIFITTN